MTFQSCLDERAAPVVADTSVVISLNATGCAEAILRALPNRCVVVEQVSLDLQVGRRTGRLDADALAVPIEENLIEHAQLEEAGLVHFPRTSSPGPQPRPSVTAKPQSSPAPSNGARSPSSMRARPERFPGLGIGCAVEVLAQQRVHSATVSPCRVRRPGSWPHAQCPGPLRAVDRKPHRKGTGCRTPLTTKRLRVNGPPRPNALLSGRSVPPEGLRVTTRDPVRPSDTISHGSTHNTSQTESTQCSLCTERNATEFPLH